MASIKSKEEEENIVKLQKKGEKTKMLQPLPMPGRKKQSPIK